MLIKKDKDFDSIKYYNKLASTIATHFQILHVKLMNFVEAPENLLLNK